MVQVLAIRVLSLMLLAAVSLALSLANHQHCAAFQLVQTRNVKTFASSTLLFSSSNNDDIPSDDGQDLAGQFYEQLKKRSLENDDESGNDSQLLPVSPTRQEAEDTDYTMDIDTPTPVRKFTGASPSLFSEQTLSSSSNGDQERQREFNLVGSFERTVGIQAAILFASIVFVASVGLTGGITDGSDRYFGGVDDIDDTAMEYVQTDDAAETMLRQSTQESLWL